MLRILYQWLFENLFCLIGTSRPRHEWEAKQRKTEGGGRKAIDEMISHEMMMGISFHTTPVFIRKK
jgi:hypothetical protein